MATPDWEAIETAYRAGVMSLREIASQHRISEGAIRKRAKRDDWSRAAEVIASVRMEHRGDIKRARQITNALFDELGAECADVAALEKLGELMLEPDDKGQSTRSPSHALHTARYGAKR